MIYLENDAFSLDVHESSSSINSDWVHSNRFWPELSINLPSPLQFPTSIAGCLYPLEGVKFAPLSGQTVEGVCQVSTALLGLLGATRSTDGWFAITDTASRTQRNERVLNFFRAPKPETSHRQKRETCHYSI